MRIGFIVGFLIGALVASVKSEPGVPEAPGLASLNDDAEKGEPGGIVGQVKAQVRMAIAAAREEADRKEDEMRRDFEASVKPQGA